MSNGDACFSRRDEPGFVHFDVSPARSSLSYLLVLGPASVLGTIIVGVIGAAIADTIGALVGVALAAVFLWFRFWRSFVKSQEHRRAVTLSVGKGGLQQGATFLAVGDIAELRVRQAIAGPNAAPLASASSFVVYGEGAVGAAAAYGAHVGNVVGRGIDKTASAVRNNLLGKQAMRSMVLTARSRAGSQDTVLAGGLTLDCAESLMADVSLALKQLTAAT